ncbi:hypothetical protein GJ698_02280 [Pseudoduganella sp. FT26W]|uniref:Uncharacterized protein n=1 Tax=Duganella aquatilis TaxID=2666082 RepID=A0A844CQB9_9BURK|nr:hypothetical protein [Duganella aquatilis]MRW82917.1 hypothetical protein [Duganella aquatilis]
MTHQVFLEAGDYVAYCSALEVRPEKWQASVLFERKVDFAKPQVPAMRHNLPDDYLTRDAAIATAIAYAEERAAHHQTGLA